MKALIKFLLNTAVIFFILPTYISASDECGGWGGSDYDTTLNSSSTSYTKSHYVRDGVWSSRTDTYYVDVTEAGTVTVELTTPTDGSVKVSYDESGCPSSSGGSVSFTKVFSSATDFNLRVYTGNTSSTNYTIHITFSATANNAPTDISLSSTSIDENNAIGDVVGTLSTTDADSGDTHTYTLVSGSGDTDNSSFTISSDQLKADEVFDYETKDSYSIRVKTDDGNGGTYEKIFTISIGDVSESSCSGCDCSLDTSSNDSSPGVVITDLNGTTSSVTKCISGSSDNGDTEYYYFEVDVNGTLEIDTSSPNSHDYHLKIGSSKGGDEYYSDTTAQDHNVSTISLTNGSSVYIYIQEEGSDTDEYQLDFNFTASSGGGSSPTIVEGTGDICYDEFTYSGMCFPMGVCKAGMGCTTSIPIRNISDDNLSDVVVYYEESGMGEYRFRL